MQKALSKQNSSIFTLIVPAGFRNLKVRFDDTLLPNDDAACDFLNLGYFEQLHNKMI